MGYIMILVLLAAGDLALKWLMEQQDPGEFPKPLEAVKGKIWLYRNHNAGFPFGFLEEYGELVRMIPLVVISGLGGILCYLIPQKGKRLQKLGLAIIIGGALSNLYDRLVRRYVVDYFSLQIGCLKKVVFNLGDICVFLGTGILMGLELAGELKSAYLAVKKSLQSCKKTVK